MGATTVPAVITTSRSLPSIPDVDHPVLVIQDGTRNNFNATYKYSSGFRESEVAIKILRNVQDPAIPLGSLLYFLIRLVTMINVVRFVCAIYEKPTNREVASIVRIVSALAVPARWPTRTQFHNGDQGTRT